MERIFHGIVGGVERRVVEGGKRKRGGGNGIKKWEVEKAIGRVKK